MKYLYTVTKYDNDMQDLKVNETRTTCHYFENKLTGRAAFMISREIQIQVHKLLEQISQTYSPKSHFYLKTSGATKRNDIVLS